MSGTTNRIVKFTASTTIGNANASDDGTTFEVLNTVGFKAAKSLAVGALSPSATTGRIDASNDIVAFSTSDKRFKENVKRIENALEKIKTIGGYSFDWREEGFEAHGFKGSDVGVIAQEIESVLPEIVKVKANGFKGVRYEKIIALVIEAIKELDDKVEQLKKQQ